MSASIHPIRSKRQVKVRSHGREIRRPETFTATHINLAAYVTAKRNEAHLDACMDELAAGCEHDVTHCAEYLVQNGLVVF